MKIRTMTGILIVALVALSVGVAAAQYGQGNGTQYVDANNDGICDNIGNCLGFVDADDDGVCDNLGDFGRGRGGCGCGEQGTNFVDANGDGICDNIGNCPGFVDADDNGVCDNSGANGRDDDGDGIPNGQDEDHISPKDGNGNRCGYGNGCNR